MAKLVILGSANSIPDIEHENTYLMVVGAEHTLLVDCVGNPIPRLQKAGADLNAITDLILTHFHPDHVAGVPMLLMSLWLLGRRAPLNIYGLAYTLERTESMMKLYNYEKWPGFFPVSFNPLPAAELTPVISFADIRVFASPVKHLIPTIGLRFEFPLSRKSAAYSCDTEPCAAVTRLAEGVDLLIHEATGASEGHSSAAQAGVAATQAHAHVLSLIHYPTQGVNLDALLEEARQTYSGPVSLATDFLSYDMG
jgi:ribonuclease Z